MMRSLKIFAIAILIFVTPLLVHTHCGLPVGSAYAQGAFGRKGGGTGDQAGQEAKAADEAKKAAEAKAAEDAKKAAEAKAAEDAKKAAEAKAADDARKATEAKAADDARKAAEAKSADDARKAADAKAADDARKAADAKAADDARKTAEARAADDARKAAEAKTAENARKAAEAKAVEARRDPANIAQPANANPSSGSPATPSTKPSTPSDREVKAGPTTPGRTSGGDTSKYERVGKSERPKPVEPVIYYPVGPIYYPPVVVIEHPVVVEAPSPTVVVSPAEPNIPDQPPVPQEPTVTVLPPEPNAPVVAVEPETHAEPVSQPAEPVIAVEPPVAPPAVTKTIAVAPPRSGPEAVSLLRGAWLERRPELLRPLLPRKGTIRILRNGKFLRSLKPADFYSMTASEIENGVTLSFNLGIVKKVKGKVTAKGYHTYRESSGKTRQTWVRCEFAQKSGRWVIGETGFQMVSGVRTSKPISR